MQRWCYTSIPPQQGIGQCLPRCGLESLWLRLLALNSCRAYVDPKVEPRLALTHGPRGPESRAPARRLVRAPDSRHCCWFELQIPGASWSEFVVPGALLVRVWRSRPQMEQADWTICWNELSGVDAGGQCMNRMPRVIGPTGYGSTSTRTCPCELGCRRCVLTLHWCMVCHTSVELLFLQ